MHHEDKRQFVDGQWITSSLENFLSQHCLEDLEKERLMKMKKEICPYMDESDFFNLASRAEAKSMGVKELYEEEKAEDVQVKAFNKHLKELAKTYSDVYFKEISDLDVQKFRKRAGEFSNVPLTEPFSYFLSLKASERDVKLNKAQVMKIYHKSSDEYEAARDELIEQGKPEKGIHALVAEMFEAEYRKQCALVDETIIANKDNYYALFGISEKYIHNPYDSYSQGGQHRAFNKREEKAIVDKVESVHDRLSQLLDSESSFYQINKDKSRHSDGGDDNTMSKRAEQAEKILERAHFIMKISLFRDEYRQSLRRAEGKYEDELVEWYIADGTDESVKQLYIPKRDSKTTEQSAREKLRGTIVDRIFESWKCEGNSLNEREFRDQFRGVDAAVRAAQN
jgi:hypothetical protein